MHLRLTWVGITQEKEKYTGLEQNNFNWKGLNNDDLVKPLQGLTQI